MESANVLQGWKDVPADLMDRVAERLTKPDYKAISLVCKSWNHTIRRRAYTAALHEGKSLRALLQRFPNLIELHLKRIQTALPDQAVHAASRHHSLRSLQLHSCHGQPALVQALAATGRLTALHISDLRRPVQGQAQVLLTCWSGLQKLHLQHTGSKELLNDLITRFEDTPQLTELSVTFRSKAGQRAHDAAAERPELVCLPSTPELASLTLDSTAATEQLAIAQYTKLTCLALVNERQLPDQFFTDVSTQTGLRSLDLSCWEGAQPSSITNASVSAVLPHLRHLTRLSLAGRSELHISCLGPLATACTALQRLNVASMKRSGATVQLPNRLTHLDISGNHGAAATYNLPAGLLHLNISDTVLDDTFARDLRTSCPNLQFVDASGCKKLRGLAGIHEFAQCHQLKKLLLDRCGIDHYLLRDRELHLATDLGFNDPWLLELWGYGVVNFHRQADMTPVAKDRGLVCRMLFEWAAYEFVFGLGVLFLADGWMGQFSPDVDAEPFGGQYLSKAFAILLPMGLFQYGVFNPILQLGSMVLGGALTPGITANRYIQRLAWHTVSGTLAEKEVYRGRWLVGPAIKRIRSKPLASQIVIFAAAFGSTGWVLLKQLRYTVQIFGQARPFLPYAAMVLGKMIYMSHMLRLCLMGMYMLGCVCSMAALLG